MVIVDGKKGHLCPECGEFAPWSAYVFAHWNIRIATPECHKCGATTILLAGEIVEKEKNVE